MAPPWTALLPLTKANIYDTIVDARTKLSETHVPTDGRWLLVSP